MTARDWSSRLVALASAMSAIRRMAERNPWFDGGLRDADIVLAHRGAVSYPNRVYPNGAHDRPDIVVVTPSNAFKVLTYVPRHGGAAEHHLSHFKYKHWMNGYSRVETISPEGFVRSCLEGGAA